MAISSRHKRNINFAMSGMTDIVFLLLIFFMLTSTLIVPGALNVTLPQSNNQTIANPEINVSISNDQKYYIDGEEVAYMDMESRLNELLGGSETPTVRLNADENLVWDQILQFIELAKRNRYRVILGTRPM